MGIQRISLFSITVGLADRETWPQSRPDVIAANATYRLLRTAFGQTLGPIGSEVPFIIEQDVPKTGIAPISLPGREWTTASLIDQLLVNGRDFIDGKQRMGVLAQ